MRKLAFVLPLFSATLLADEVYLRGGGHLSGNIVGRTETQITLEIGPGRVSFPMDRVERIQEGTSPLTEFRRRRAALAQDDVAGFLALALWARDHDLNTQARELFEVVAAFDPSNAMAQLAIGNVRLGDHFVTREESNRAQGLILFEGSWMSPAERDALLTERVERARAEAARAQAEAEREAQAAAAAQAASETGYGMPFYGGYGYPGYGTYYPHRFSHHTRVIERVSVVPRVSTPLPHPTSIQGTQSRATTAGLSKRTP